MVYNEYELFMGIAHCRTLHSTRRTMQCAMLSFEVLCCTDNNMHWQYYSAMVSNGILFTCPLLNRNGRAIYYFLHIMPYSCGKYSERAISLPHIIILR